MAVVGETVFLSGAGLGLAVGAGAAATDQPAVASVVWAVTTLAALAVAGAWLLQSVRRHQMGVDVIAALALLGTLVVGEYLAGAVIAVMLATGRALEGRANARAARELHALVARAPNIAQRYDGEELVSVAVSAVVPGDKLLVMPGRVVPVDGIVLRGRAVLDESALTGEPLPVEHDAGEAIRSGVVNGGLAFDMRATTSAADSTYAGIVRLVAQAQSSTAPFVRLADRWALVFVPVTLTVAAIAGIVSGDMVRAVAVLVVATPCPLILAAPVAVVAGLAQAARRGVIVKGGAVLEALAGGGTLLLDKTGTLTVGRPSVVEIVAAEGEPAGDVLRLAASVGQASPHVLAAAVVRGAQEQGLELSLPTDVEEVTGQGVRGRVDGRPVATGKLAWLSAGLPPPPWTRAVARRAARDGLLTVFVRVEDRIAGAALLDDPIRPDARRTLRQLRRDGIRRIVMVTGDRAETAQSVGTALGVDEVLAERSPAEKVAAVQAEQRNGRTIMVGDGINDGPALAVADVGVAMATRGSSASSDAADIVLTVDRLDRLGDAMRAARRSRHIAVQSVVVGMTLSAVAMVVAALGWLPPTAGAVAQEGIDLAAILNALRAVRTLKDRDQLEGEGATLGRHYASEHRLLRPGLDQLHRVADDLSAPLSDALLNRLRIARAFLVEQILPHELEEDAMLYPVLARAFGGRDATGTMTRAHAEISHLIRRFDRLVDAAEARRVDPGMEDDIEELNELRGALYGLYAILKLHFAQEDEEYFSLLPDTANDDSRPQPQSSGTGVRSVAT